MSSPDDHIHDEAVAQQADHEHHRVHRGDDGDDGGHALLLPALIIAGHIAAVSGHPNRGIHRTVLQQPGQALVLFFKNFNWCVFHVQIVFSRWAAKEERKKKKEEESGT